MTRMGLSNVGLFRTGSSSVSSSQESTPRPATKAIPASLSSAEDPLVSITDNDAIRLVGIYQDEIQSVHPIIETQDLVQKIPQILDSIRTADQASANTLSCDKKDVYILRIPIATAVLCESHGRNGVSNRLVVSVKQGVGKISNDKELVI